MTGVDRAAAGSFISRVKILAGTEAAYRASPAEAPGLYAKPAEVLHRVAGLSEFPIQHATDSFFADDKIPTAEIAVNHAMPLLLRHVSLGPAKREFQRGQPKAIMLNDPAMGGDMSARILHHQERHVGSWDAMDRGQDLATLPRH